MRRALTAALTVLVLGGCAREPSEATWVTGFGFGWELFNHRLSWLDVPAAGGDPEVVGGASTIGELYDDGGTCVNPDTCWELPAFDEATTFVERATVRTSAVELVPFTAELVVGPEGGDAVVTVPVRRTDGVPVAWIAGLTLDTNTPHGTASCYDPRYGWLPTHLALRVDADLPVDGAVAVTVAGDFASGLSLEEERACFDEAAPGAAVRLVVDGVLAVGPVVPAAVTVERGALWEGIARNEADQPLADLGDLSITTPFAEPVLGWRSLDFRFRESVPSERGHYLRTLELVADPFAREAYAYATNASFTALSDFGFTFEGELVAYERGALEGR